MTKKGEGGEKGSFASHPHIRMTIPPHHDVKIALLQPIHQSRSPGSFHARRRKQDLLHGLMTHSLLRVWQIDVRCVWRGILVIVHEGFVVFVVFKRSRYAECKARQGKEIFDGGYEVHAAVAGEGVGAGGGAEIVLHVDDEEGGVECHGDGIWGGNVERL